MKKAIILIDGQNLFYTLKNIGLQERDITWTMLFKSLLDPTDELLRTYWFRPQRLQDSHFNKYGVTNQIIYKNYNGCYDYYQKKEFNKISTETWGNINREVGEVMGWLEDQRIRFNKIEYNYDQLCLDNSEIEIVKTGIVKVNPYIQEYLGEKGVDIALAVKMIALSVEKKCDKIILMSGDYDYAEAIKYVKNNMTKVNIVKLHKGVPPKNRNLSYDLSVLADKIIDIYETDIKSKFLK